MSGPLIVRWPQIEQALTRVDAVAEMQAGFIAYSAGRCVIPPVGELRFEDPVGDVHIKYGYVRGEDRYVIKIASGFPGNAAAGQPNNDGMMLLFSQQTGAVQAMLLDEGKLTDLRTAAAGALAARTLAKRKVNRIGILGTGLQARLQLKWLEGITSCRDVTVCGRREEAVHEYVADVSEWGFQVEPTLDPDAMASSCDLIVTTTAATEPMIRAEALQAGTHITAMGSDTPDKQELETEVLRRADLVVVDSLSQGRERGEVAQALRAGSIDEAAVVELGAILAGDASGRTDDDQITVADLTGVAVQDLMIASAVVRDLTR